MTNKTKVEYKNFAVRNFFLRLNSKMKRKNGIDPKLIRAFMGAPNKLSVIPLNSMAKTDVTTIILKTLTPLAELNDIPKSSTLRISF
jgi:hypothetical protein